MKKIYNTPVVEFVELKSCPVMTTMSLPTDGGGESEGRGDWNNIWEGM